MKTQQLGVSDMQVTRVAQGCMMIGGGWDRKPISEQTKQEAVKTVRAALDCGINFFDHADIYGMGKAQQAFSAVWKEVPHLREKIYLQSKAGIRFGGDPAPDSPGRYDFSYEHIIEGVEFNLKGLQTDYLDVLLLHRPDPLVEPEEVARAFDELARAGKVRWFGVSNHTAAELELLRRYVAQPIVANQVEFNILHTNMLDEGVNFNQYTPRMRFNEGTIEYCRLHNITLQSWGSMARGLLSGRDLNGQPENVKTAEAAVKELAQQKGCPPEAIVIAWILRHPARIQAIIGTTEPQRIQACCEADQVELTREEWYRLYIAGRGEGLP